MNKFLVTVTIIAGLGAPIAATAPAAEAKPGCVSPREAFTETSTGDSRMRVKRVFDTDGVLVDRWRSGRNGRKLDVLRQYRPCGANRDDVVVVNFDDYTYGSPTRGGTLRMYAGIWDHLCRDYEDYFSYEGEWVTDPATGAGYWDPEYYEYYEYSYCYDSWFEGEFYDESMAGRRPAGGAAKETATQDRDPVISVRLDARALKRR